jgi:hypothetical protein
LQYSQFEWDEDTGHDPVLKIVFCPRALFISEHYPVFQCFRICAYSTDRALISEKSTL